MSIELTAMTREQLLSEWQKATAAVKAWQEHERPLREQVVKAFADPRKPEGSQTVKGEFGKLSITQPVTYKLENKDGETQRLAAEMPLDMQLRLFKWKADINIKEFNLLKQLADNDTVNGNVDSENNRWIRAIESILTIQPGSPQAKFEPKDEE